MFSQSKVELQPGGLDAALMYCKKNPTPELLVVEIAEQNSELLARVDQLADVCDATTRVIVIGHSNDIGTYRTLLRRGVSDYLPSPISRATVIESVQGLFNTAGGQALARTIAFFGAKGGVGSSTIACNTGWALARMFSQDVAVVDLDVAFGTVALAFNVDAPQGIDAALTDGARLDDELLARYMPKYDDHLALLASPASLDANPAVDRVAFERVLEKVRRASRFVVLDLPHAWAPWVRDTLTDADEVVMTVAPDLAALRNAKRLIESLRPLRGQDRPLRYVLNHVGGAKKTELSAKEITEGLGLPPTVVIPHDTAVLGAAANNGQMAGEVQKKGHVIDAFRQLALAISNQPPTKGKKSPLDWLKRTNG